jgi:hypothetical protein
MAQTKKKRRSKHRGTPAGTIESRGRTGRKPTSEERKTSSAKARADRFDRPPNWRSAATRAALAAGLFFIAVAFLFKQPLAGAISISVAMFAIYIPLGFYTDRFLYNRRQRQKATAGKPKAKGD